MTALALQPADLAQPRRRLAYQVQDSRLTLAEGLAEYYAANVGTVTPPSALSPESADLFRRHDMCHVIFGLDTTIADEALADTRTMLSCDVGFSAYAAYLKTNEDAQAIFRETGYLRTAWITLLAVPRMLHAALLALGARRKWPWNPPEEFLGRRLGELRAEFGIRVI